MASFTKTIQTQATYGLSLQSLAADTTVVSTVLDVATLIAASIFFRFGRTVTTALTRGTQFLVEGSWKSTGDADWGVLGGAQFISNIATSADEAVSGTCNAGQKVIAMASTTGFTVGMLVFIKNGTFGNSEFGFIAKVDANTSITLVDNLVNAQTGSTVYEAQRFTAIDLSLQGAKRIRLVAIGGTQATAVEAQIITCDSIG